MRHSAKTSHKHVVWLLGSDSRCLTNESLGAKPVKAMLDVSRRRCARHHLIQTEAECSHAMTVMDKVGGWHEREGTTYVGESEDSDIGGTLAACIWILSKAVLYNGRKNMEEFRDRKRNSVIEAVNWSCSRVLPSHEVVSGFCLGDA